MGQIPLKPEYFERGGEKFGAKEEVEKWLDNQNKERWTNQISNLTLDTNRSREGIAAALRPQFREEGEKIIEMKEIKEIRKKGLEMYKYYLTDPSKVEQELSEIKNKYPKMDPEIVTSAIRNT